MFVNTLPKYNGVPSVTFEYAKGTREADKVSKDILTAHYAVSRILNLIGAAEPVDYEEESDQDSAVLARTAPSASNPAAQRVWHQTLVAKLHGYGLTVR